MVVVVIMCAVCGFCGHNGSLYVFTNCSLFAKLGSLSHHVCQFGLVHNTE